jgi:hypothetical protein
LIALVERIEFAGSEVEFVSFHFDLCPFRGLRGVHAPNINSDFEMRQGLFSDLRYIVFMQIEVMVIPAGKVGHYNCQHLPRMGDILDLRDAGGSVPELEIEPMYVAQIIHRLGPEPECQTIVLRVLPESRWVSEGVATPNKDQVFQ